MNDCAQLRQDYEAYALGVLDPEERAEIDAHLNRGCPDCTTGVAQARQLVAQLAYLAPEVEPPAPLRRKVLERVGVVSAPARLRTLPVWAWAAAAALALFSIFSSYQVSRLSDELARLTARIESERARGRELEAQLRSYERMQAIVSSPEMRAVSLRPAAAPQPVIRAFWNEQLGIVLSANQMPAPASDRTYQLWVVPKKGAPIDAGIFRPDAAGTVLVVSQPNARIADAAALAITDEPAGGRPTPTLPPMWAGAVGN